MIQKKILSNTANSFAANFVDLIARIAVTLAIARILGPERMGLYALVFAILTILGLFADFGLANVARRYISEFKSRGDVTDAESLFRYLLFFKVATSVAAAVLLFSLGSLIAVFYENAELNSILPIAALYMLPFGITTLLGNVVMGLQDFRTIRIRALVTAPLFFGLALATLLGGASLIGILYVHLFIRILEGGIYWFAIRRILGFRLRTRNRLKPGVKSSVIRYNWVVGSIRILDGVVWHNSEVFILGKLSTAVQTGYYAATFGLAARIVEYIPNVYVSVLIPAFSELHGKGKKDEISYSYVVTTRHLMLVALPCAAVGIVLAPDIISLLLGNEYLPATAVLQVLLISACGTVLAGAASSVIYGVGNPQVLLWIVASLAVVNIGANILLIPVLGALGAALSNAAVHVLGCLFGTIAACKILRIRFPLEDLYRILLASLSMAGLLAICRAGLGWIGIGPGLVLGAFAFLLVILRSRALCDVDIKLLEIASRKLPSRLRAGAIKVLRFAGRYTRRLEPVEAGVQ